MRLTPILRAEGRQQTLQKSRCATSGICAIAANSSTRMPEIFWQHQAAGSVSTTSGCMRGMPGINRTQPIAAIADWGFPCFRLTCLG
jgi:hypothetical protein